MNDIYKEKHILHKFIEIETKHNLLDIDFEGLQIYPMLRVNLYYEITKRLSIFSTQDNIQKTNSKARILWDYFKHAIRFNDLTPFKKCDVVLLEHPRKVKIDEKYIDIYSHDLVSQLPYSKCVIKIPSYGAYPPGYKDPRKGVMFYDYFLLKKKILIRFNQNNPKALEVASIINKAFGEISDKKQLDLTSFLKDQILKYYYGYKIAKAFLSKLSPKVFILANPYGFADFAHAAHDLKIPTIELQHSIISDTHPGYNFPQAQFHQVKYFPDYIFSFGNYWKTAANYPIPKDNILPVGFHYFETKKQKIQSTHPKRDTILFISQKTIGKELSLFACEVAKAFPQYQVLYKLHPKQFSTWKEDLPNLNDPSLTNLEVAGDLDIYPLFERMICQIGVFSTLVYEGLAFGVKTFIFKLPGWQYMERLIDAQNAILIDSLTDFKNNLSDQSLKQIDADEIFAANTTNNQLKFLQSLFQGRPT